MNAIEAHAIAEHSFNTHAIIFKAQVDEIIKNDAEKGKFISVINIQHTIWGVPDLENTIIDSLVQDGYAVTVNKSRPIHTLTVKW